MNKFIYILRGVSGSGKTTFAESLTMLGFPAKGPVICCADDYMTDGKGNYDFKPEKLGYVHNKCWNLFEECVKKDEQFIVVANTNTSEKEFKKYFDYGQKHGYYVFTLILENRHGNKDVHNVPSETLERQKQKLTSNIKL